MPNDPELRTSRLVLRRWRDTDRAPFAALNADPVVMEHFPAPLRREESDDLADRIAAGLDERGWGLWAVEIPGTVAFAGFIGLNPATFDAPFTPAVEVGWRLARAHWGRGYASEGASAALSFGFDALALEEIVSFTTHGNTRSRRVMERVGMRRDPADDFDNPNVPNCDALRPHVLYRLDRASWERNAPREAR
jgi:RimJ/RimL family protein N-acetyltransferase